MKEKKFRISDKEFQLIIGNLLRFGVLLAGVIVLLGGIVYVSHHWNQPVDYKVFHSVPPDLCHIRGILYNAMEFRGKGLIQLGIIFLIATPVTRVALSIIGFSLQKDYMYVVVTVIVFAVLLYSLISS